jgi:hypothetical protein
MSLQQYLDLYKEPLSEDAMQVSIKLIEVAQEKQKKKGQGQEGEEESEDHRTYCREKEGQENEESKVGTCGCLKSMDFLLAAEGLLRVML